MTTRTRRSFSCSAAAAVLARKAGTTGESDNSNDRYHYFSSASDTYSDNSNYDNDHYSDNSNYDNDTYSDNNYDTYSDNSNDHYHYFSSASDTFSSSPSDYNGFSSSFPEFKSDRGKWSDRWEIRTIGRYRGSRRNRGTGCRS